MSDILPFKPRVESQQGPADEPHIAGPAKCVACGYRFIVVTPVKRVQNLECPACTLEKAALVHMASWAGAVFHCSCGNDLMQVMQKGSICVNCGLHWPFKILEDAFK